MFLNMKAYFHDEWNLFLLSSKQSFSMIEQIKPASHFQISSTSILLNNYLLKKFQNINKSFLHIASFKN